MLVLGESDGLRLLDHSRQFEQLGETKRRTSSGQHDKRIDGQNTRPPGGKGGQLPRIIVEVDAILAPVLTVSHQSELPSTQRMERMRHSKALVLNVQIGCS